jgi:lysophospholipase L1-like esterase
VKRRTRGSTGRSVAWLVRLVLAGILAGCGSDAPRATTPVSALATPAPAATAASPSVGPSPTPVSTISGPHLTLVGLGDSVPGGLKCNDPCRSYVFTYGELAATALGEAVVTNNLATNDGLESRTLLDRVEKDATYRMALAGADIVTLQVGWNDWQGPCNFANHRSCLVFGQERVEPNLDAILAEIEALREGKATAMRVVTYYNGYLGNELAPSIWSFSGSTADIATFDKDFRAALLAFNAMICRLAEAHSAVCVDVAPAFNGANLDQPAATGLINSDGIHGLAGGHSLIARTLAAAGFSELR